MSVIETEHPSTSEIAPPTLSKTTTGPLPHSHPKVSGLLLAQAASVIGITAWLTLILINNITDPGTNAHLIARMIHMDDLVADPVRGNGLEWRALPASLGRPLLYAVIVYQIFTVALMWRACFRYLSDMRHRRTAARASTVSAVNVAMTVFLGLFFGFLVGGLWFGYWMTMGPVQQVHFTLVLIAFGVLLLANKNHDAS